ncbi:hypothetical protein J5N97_025345 [Dioscorea zingiberensis]|uniref:Uncharacterized protein n=1 Tax=Dioscorea zingiberensis TaxID=325984 RepID=A0A9D5C8W6_9LILI|nr:hypothetical protein J5N97_025345 [Dioscorea zingiberensis]
MENEGLPRVSPGVDALRGWCQACLRLLSYLASSQLLRERLRGFWPAPARLSAVFSGQPAEQSSSSQVSYGTSSCRVSSQRLFSPHARFKRSARGPAREQEGQVGNFGWSESDLTCLGLQVANRSAGTG